MLTTNTTRTTSNSCTCEGNYLNLFYTLNEVRHFSAKDAMLYFYLVRMHLAFKAKGTDVFWHNNKQTARAMNASVNTMKSARERLVEAGLVRYTQDGSRTFYRIADSVTITAATLQTAAAENSALQTTAQHSLPSANQLAFTWYDTTVSAVSLLGGSTSMPSGVPSGVLSDPYQNLTPPLSNFDTPCQILTPLNSLSLEKKITKEEEENFFQKCTTRTTEVAKVTETTEVPEAPEPPTFGTVLNFYNEVKKIDYEVAIPLAEAFLACWERREWIDQESQKSVIGKWQLLAVTYAKSGAQKRIEADIYRVRAEREKVEHEAFKLERTIEIAAEQQRQYDQRKTAYEKASAVTAQIQAQAQAQAQAQKTTNNSASSNFHPTNNHGHVRPSGYFAPAPAMATRTASQPHEQRTTAQSNIPDCGENSFGETFGQAFADRFAGGWTAEESRQFDIATNGRCR